jgi:3,4-dihydroxy 2-butanone 4-phosphate synthase/GTP cyclohydrolase II
MGIEMDDCVAQEPDPNTEKRTNQMKLNSIPELVDDIRAGRMIVLIDDEDRENEGDLVMAASMVRPEDINFMARFGRGLICMPITRERCTQLNLPLMVNNNEARFATNFTISMEAAEGITTGISAYDRAHTIRTAVRPDAEPADISQPGHIFPLMTQPGGVLSRAGHTEASADLAMLAGLEPAAVLVEILNEDGTMARRPQLEEFAKTHNLKIGTIADLISYRMETERSVECVSTHTVDTNFGTFQLLTYRDSINHRIHLALVKGQIDSDEPLLVRVHVQNTLSDTLGIKRDDFGLPLRVAMAEIAREGAGIVLVLASNEDDEDLLRRIQSQPKPNILKSGDNRQSIELRTYGIGAQIIADLGVKKMRVLSAPKHMTGLAGFGLEVVEYVETEGHSREQVKSTKPVKGTGNE